MTINLGDEAKDTITGISGIVVATTEWLHGCRRITLQPTKMLEGKYPDQLTFDEPQLAVIRKRKVREGSHATGGPRPEPMRPRTPPR